jgi:hypothetical protein
MKYLITEKQLKTLRKYMKNFINENQTKGYDALKEFPFSELPEDGYIERVQGWGSVQVPSGDDSLRTMKSKRDLIEFINSFKSAYDEDPMFEINPNEVWHSKIKIINDSFQDDTQSFIRKKSSDLERDREKGFSID